MVRSRLRIIRNIVIPNEGLAPDVGGDVCQMLGRIAVGNDLLPGPKEIDTAIDDSAQILQISIGRRAELACKARIIRVVRRTDDETLGVTPSTDVGNHSRLKVR